MQWRMKVRRKASLWKVPLLTIDKFDQVEEEMYIEEQLSQMGLVEFETFDWFRWKKTYGDDVSWQEHWIKIIALQNVYSLPLK